MIGDYQILSLTSAASVNTIAARPPEGMEWEFVGLKAAHTDDGAARDCAWRILRNLPGAAATNFDGFVISLAHSTYVHFSWDMTNVPDMIGRGMRLLANHYWYPEFLVNNLAAGKQCYIRAIVIERPEKLDVAILNAQGVDIQVPYRR